MKDIKIGNGWQVVECDFSIAKNPGGCAPITLRTVYALCADRSYNVPRTDPNRNGYIALRTISGSGNLMIRGAKPLAADSGSLIICEYAAIERYYCADYSWEFWWFQFDCAEGVALPLNRAIQLELTEMEIQERKQCLDLLKIESEAANRLASSVLGTLYYRWLFQYQNITMPGSPYQADIQKVILQMKTNMKEPLRLEDMAGMIGVCERRFRQIFKTVTGMSPKKYYDAVRIGMAEALLRTTPLSMAQIADHLGYSSPYHFCRVFSQARGVSPAAFRKGAGRPSARPARSHTEVTCDEALR